MCELYIMKVNFHLKGVAHAGLGAGAERLTRTAIPKVIQMRHFGEHLLMEIRIGAVPKVSEALASHPDYDLLITGYSLGAGEVAKVAKAIEQRLQA